MPADHDTYMRIALEEAERAGAEILAGSMPWPASQIDAAAKSSPNPKGTPAPTAARVKKNFASFIDSDTVELVKVGTQDYRIPVSTGKSNRWLFPGRFHQVAVLLDTCLHVSKGPTSGQTLKPRKKLV